LEQLGRATRFLAAAGCRICVGTDFDSPFIEPGAGVLAEMRDLETAGMERLDIIRAATSTAADLLGLTDQIGVVAPGARADLLVLRANPFETLEALARPELVIAAGRVVADRRPESST
jgi:imidazolonepropionase-like amidohydrolase